MGNFHPHGDQAIYDALVRLAQDFAQRYPLVDGQGNFGNVDGDNAAAMRYTEARLTEVARLLIDELTRIRSISVPPTTAPMKNRWSCRPLFQICLRTVRRALRLEWRRLFRRTMQPNCAMRRFS